jgi:glyoxylase-like metal-dependent hydrolase (beta-lactamase superfamily II)
MANFASSQDLTHKVVSFDELGAGLYAYTAEGDPNSGIMVGPDGVVVVDAQATPLLARAVQQRIAEVTALPVRQVVLTHYHAVRVLGASGYPAHSVIASDATRALIVERGQRDMDSENCMPFNASRAFDEASGIENPRIWTAERDLDMWAALEKDAPPTPADAA